MRIIKDQRFPYWLFWWSPSLFLGQVKFKTLTEKVCCRMVISTKLCSSDTPPMGFEPTTFLNKNALSELKYSSNAAGPHHAPRRQWPWSGLAFRVVQLQLKTLTKKWIHSSAWTLCLRDRFSLRKLSPLLMVPIIILGQVSFYFRTQPKSMLQNGHFNELVPVIHRRWDSNPQPLN